jgi:hypothetical protein
MKISPNEELDNWLIQLFLQMRSVNIPVNGPVLLEKATEVSVRLQIDNFGAERSGLTHSETAMVYPQVCMW